VNSYALSACALVILIATPFAMVAFGTAAPPPPNDTFTAPPATSDTALLETYTARDGARLSVRRFDADASSASASAPVAILLHGSGGSSLFMSTLGHALADTGVTTYAPDFRGSGLSGHSGDINHIGQLEEDLEDLLAGIKAKQGDARFVLIGFSAGGSFALRIAAEKVGAEFAGIVAIAPYLGLHDEATRPTNAGGWVSIFAVRCLGLKLLNGVGVHRFDGLPILAFALPPNVEPAGGEPTWSYRMLENFITSGSTSVLPPRRTWRDDIKGAEDRLSVVFGAEDAGIDAEKAKSEFAAAAPSVPVTVVDGTGHVGLVRSPEGVSTIVGLVVPK
jgi:pimeloyl-ACP methyl ester carboxylesterase